MKKLKRECWKDNPNERPTMHEFVKSLKAIIFGENNDEVNSIIHSENKAELLKKTTSYSASCMHSNNSELFIS